MKLLIEDDQGNRSVVPVIRDEITIGRKEGNTIRLTERNVSRRHAKLVRNDGRIYVEDVEARYGVKKNGQKIDDRAEFSEGDVVLIGDYRLTLRPEQAKAAQSADANGAAAAEISPELQEEETKVQEVDELEGAPETGAGAEQSSPSPDTEVIESEPAELVVVSSNFAGQDFPLDREEMVIGRGENCDIIIDHRSVSNTHAKIIRESADTYKIVDLNSRNGVKVSGEEYKSVHLERGDIIELGHVKFRFVEPGENYVFTPQEATESPAQGSSINPVAVFGVAVVVVAVFSGVYILLTSEPPSDAEETIEKGARAESETATPEEKENDEETEQDRQHKKVQSTIEQAKRDIESGKLEKAIGSLESTQNLLEPTREQGKTIDKLLSTARNEQPFRRHFDSAQDSIADEEYREALEKLDKIPDHSVFADLVEKEGLEAKALDGLLATTETKVEEEEYEKAEEQIEVALQFDSHKDQARKLLDDIESARQKKRHATAQNTAQEGSSNSAPTPDPTPEPDDEPEPSESNESTGSQEGSSPGVTQAEAEKLFQNATKKWIRGDHQGALSDCRRAIRAGYSDCFRVMGMANKQLGNTEAACRNFKRYLGSSPSDAAKIRDVMDDMECP